MICDSGVIDDDSCGDLQCLDFNSNTGVTRFGDSGTCGLATACAGEGAFCGAAVPVGVPSAGACCGGLERLDEVCVAICGELGADCDGNEDCCADLVCTDGACTVAPVDTGGENPHDVVTLPDPGPGSDNDRANGLLMGAAIEVEAAALVAANNLRDQPAPVKATV